MESQSTISPPLSPSPCFLLGSPAPMFTPSLPTPPALFLSSSTAGIPVAVGGGPGNLGSSGGVSSSSNLVDNSGGVCPPSLSDPSSNSQRNSGSSINQSQSGSNYAPQQPLLQQLHQQQLQRQRQRLVQQNTNINLNNNNSTTESTTSTTSTTTTSSSSSSINDRSNQSASRPPLDCSSTSVPLPSDPSTPCSQPMSSSGDEEQLASSSQTVTVNIGSPPSQHHHILYRHDDPTSTETDTTSTTTTSTTSTTTTSSTNTSLVNNSNAAPLQLNLKRRNSLKRTHIQADLDQVFHNHQHKQQLQLSEHSLPNQLLQREIRCPRPGTNSLQSRKFYLNVVPDKTVYNIETPLCTIKKFTSDGERLLCFSKDLKEIHLYRFLGASPKYPVGVTKTQRAKIDRTFSTYFRPIYQRAIPPFNEFLCKDFSLTTTCGKYFILASCGQSANNTTTPLTLAEEQSTIRQSPAHSINLPNPDDVSFYLVRIEDGQVCDRRTFKKDVIHLAHHSGVYLYQDFFIVLSLQYQTIHIFQIKGSSFVNIRHIGPHCNEDDQLELDTYQHIEQSFISRGVGAGGGKHATSDLSKITPFAKDHTSRRHNVVAPPEPTPVTTTNTTTTTTATTTAPAAPAATTATTMTTTTNNQPSNLSSLDLSLANHSLPISTVCGIKQRFLSYMFKKALMADEPRKALSMYYSLFPQYCNLVMWKMQSLDASHLLIKYGPIDGLLGRLTDYCNQISYFVVYNLHTTEVIGVYENSNKEFAKTFEQFCEHFRACSCPSGLIKFRSTCSNNIYVREHLLKQKMAVINARYGGETQAVKRILSALPFSPQSWNESPYFDKYLFSYDEKIISSTERPKPLVDYPIKFYSRFNGEVKFKLSTGVQDKNERQAKKYASYIFHPYSQFIISLQHNPQTNNVVANFHYKSDDLEREEDFIDDTAVKAGDNTSASSSSASTVSSAVAATDGAPLVSQVDDDNNGIVSGVDEE
ncbi:hypothetical protein SAMD00019534_044180 [Acytostelium subglobosum LB1]|uniref:hypothetical protein n=1 Tax=Acytostelium subglobosum LB1 TaxID=1410327 RepID=UPI0006448EBA|nr:hypothetical protein SAMD00019534_044180 [Acytostelium subglobosum LB1]GAM21243.1 hypothetical protein SAMD00019534_044180 [Acytostelium subglobosum LB1]|eukprot:XP_012755362.1 hypothetical protein SAMD00019534_044180 [Acytostelium subglobosum LB1]